MPRPWTESAANWARKAGLVYVIAGYVSYFVGLRVFPRVSVVTAMASGGLNLAVGGFGLLWWAYWTSRRRRLARSVALATLSLPVLTVVVQGFLGFGVGAWVPFMTLLSVFYRPRWMVVVGTGLCLFLGLSLFPVYMNVRGKIRQVVWGGQSLEQRITVITDSLVQAWQWFDVEQKDQLNAFEDRLNHNALLGKAVRRASEGRVEFAQGETLVHAVLTLIPRAVWPGKPEYAGSGNLVSRFTGVKFARGTSVGMGPVMELYVNFGQFGVLIGFVVIGTVLGVVDRRAGAYLVGGDWPGFIQWYVPGLALLNVGGNFAEVTGCAAACILLYWLVNSLFINEQSRSAAGSRPGGVSRWPPAEMVPGGRAAASDPIRP